MPKSPYAPCIPTRGTAVPSHPDWIHEVKQDSFRLIVERNHDRVRLFTRNVVAFGSTVTFRPTDGRVQKYRIVGEDEADPKGGSISFTSPVAKSLMGRTVGEIVGAGSNELEIIAIA